MTFSKNEIFGQIVRMAGPVTEGNTSGNNVGPLKRMTIAPQLAKILARVSAGKQP